MSMLSKIFIISNKLHESNLSDLFIQEKWYYYLYTENYAFGVNMPV